MTENVRYVDIERALLKAFAADDRARWTGLTKDESTALINLYIRREPPQADWQAYWLAAINAAETHRDWPFLVARASVGTAFWAVVILAAWWFFAGDGARLDSYVDLVIAAIGLLLVGYMTIQLRGTRVQSAVAAARKELHAADAM